MSTLFGKLREHELELGRLKKEEEGEKRQSITLKVTAKTINKSKAIKVEEMADQEDENSDSKTLNLMVKSFSRFRKYKNKSNTKCYECGKFGHIKPDCPILNIKKKLEEKSEATSRSKRVKKTYIA